jgi:UDP-2,3-diacylglucosamine pyrophosphatase LpxH
MKSNYKSIFISDVHLGSKHCQADILLKFLKEYKCETLYLIGDIIDFWKLKRKFRITAQQVAVIQKILKLSKKGTAIKYVLGNHDADIRPFLKYNINIENIEIKNEFIHETVDGKKLLIIHGDFCDFLCTSAKWVTYLGDHAYTVALHFNDMVNFIRRKIGLPYFSVSRYLKQNVKEAVGFVFDFEKTISTYTKKRGCFGVLAGHIHSAEIKFVDDVLYMNDGDFVESCSAICETYEGDFILIHYSLGKWETIATYDIKTGTVI